MNNISAFDYVNSDYTDDNDFCIARASTEYPRITPSYKNKFDFNERPWGTKKDPIPIDFF
jgi:hypothetical protein